MRLITFCTLCASLYGQTRAKGRVDAIRNLETIKSDVNKVGENMENLAFDVVGQLMEASDLFNGNSEEDWTNVAEEASTRFETTENTLEENTPPGSTKQIGTERPHRLRLNRLKRAANKWEQPQTWEQPNIDSNLIHVNSKEHVDRNNFRMESPRQREFNPEFQVPEARDSIPEAIPEAIPTETCTSKTKEEMKLESDKIKEINEEIKKLNELVVLLRDQQRIMKLLSDGKTTNDITRRFGSADLLKVLNELNSQQSNTREQRNDATGTTRTTHEELEAIRNELRETISTLNKTKIILAMEREKEVALEKELKTQKEELSSLRSKIEGILSMSSSKSRFADNDFVGAPLTVPKLLPLLPPQRKNDTILEQSERSSFRSNTRASELQRLIRMLENEEEKKSKSEDMEDRIKDLEKKLEDKQSKKDDINLDSSQLMRRLLLARLLNGQGSNGFNSDGLPKKLSDALESQKDPAQKRIDELNELRVLEAAIQGLRPKDQLDLDDFGGKQDEAQFQAMVTKLIQQGAGSSSGPNALPPIPSASLKNPMDIFSNTLAAPQVPGLKLTPEQIIALKSQIGQYGGGYQNNDGIADLFSNYQGKGYAPSKLAPYPLPYQPIPNIPYAPSYTPSYPPIRPSYGPYANPSYPDLSGYNAKPYGALPYGPYSGLTANYASGPQPYSSSPNNYAASQPYRNLYGTSNAQLGYTPSKTYSSPVPNYAINSPAYSQAVDYSQNNFFRVPQSKGDYNPPPPNGPYAPKNDGGPGYDQQGYNSQGSQYVPEQYKYQKIEELKSQVQQLEGVINNLNRPEYTQKPEDKDNISHLEKKMYDLKGVINSLAQQPSYSNDAQPQPESYASNPLPPQPPPQVPPTYNQDQNQNIPQPIQNYENKSRRRRSVEDNQANGDAPLWNNIGNFFSTYIDTNDTTSNAQRSNSFNDVKQRIDDLKKQLEPYTQTQDGFQRTSFEPPNYKSYQPPSYPSYQDNYQNVPLFNPLDMLQTKKDDLFTGIVVKILDKVIAATPAIITKLFGIGISELSNSYGDSYSEVQTVLKNLGLIGYLPLILVKLVEGLTAFLRLLKKNPTIRYFLVPVLILGLVAGAIIFLIWWLLPDYPKGQYQLGYEDSYNSDNSYNERKALNHEVNRYMVNHDDKKLASSYPVVNNNLNQNPIPYSRTYFESGNNLNWDNILR